MTDRNPTKQEESEPRHRAPFSCGYCGRSYMLPRPRACCSRGREWDIKMIAAQKGVRMSDEKALTSNQSGYETVDRIRRSHRAARPNPSENPAWANCHLDCGVLLAEIERLSGPGNPTQLALDEATKPLHVEIERLRALLVQSHEQCRKPTSCRARQLLWPMIDGEPALSSMRPSAPETKARRSTERLIFDGADGITRPVKPIVGTDKAISDDDLRWMIRMETESKYHRAFVELWERRGSPEETSTELCRCRDVLVMDGKCTQCRRPVRLPEKGKSDV